MVLDLLNHSGGKQIGDLRGHLYFYGVRVVQFFYVMLCELVCEGKLV